MTKAEYTERVPRWSDFPKLARYGATDEHGPYRVRQLPDPKVFRSANLCLSDGPENHHTAKGRWYSGGPS